MTALVTGATGFLGRHIVAALRARELPVRALTRPGREPPELGPGVTWVEGDLTDAASLRAALEGCSSLYHAAACYTLWSSSPDILREANVEGTRRILELAAEAGVERVVYTSSVSCIGARQDGGPADESRDPDPDELCGPYKQTKFEAELIARERAAAGQDIVIVNPASIIGPGDVKPTPTGKIIVDFLAGRMPAFVETGLNFVDVRDVAEGHVLAHARGERGRRYILGHCEQNLSLRDFLARLAEVSGLPAPTLRIPYAVAYSAGWVSTRWADWVTGREPGIPLDGVKMSRQPMQYDARRAVAELGLPQRPLEESLRDAVRDILARGLVTGPRAERARAACVQGAEEGR